MTYTLDHSASDVLRQHLLNQGEVDLPSSGGSWPCLLSYLMDGVDINNVIVMYDTNPNLDGRSMEDGEVIFHHGISIMLRSSDYEAGYLKMHSLMTVLSSVVREVITMGSTAIYLIQSVANQSGVVYLGVEDGTKRRRLFEMGLLVSVTKY